MIRILLLTLLFAVLAGTTTAPAETPTSGASLREDMQTIAGFSPRLEGSSGEKSLVAWVKARLASLGVPYTTLDFSQSDFEHSFSSCIRVDIRGAVQDSLIVAVPLNTPPGAQPDADGSVNVAIALDLVRRAQGARLPVSLTVLFLGAEFGDTDSYPMGSTLFLRDFQPDYRAAVIYLNLRAVPRQVLVRGGGRGIVSPYWLMNRCVDALRQARVPFLLRGDETQIFRMGTTDERTVIEPYLKAGYPSVGIEGEYGTPTAADGEEWLASFSTFLQGFISASASGIPEEWDRHYLLLQAAGLSVILPERVYIGILLGTIALVFLYSLLFRKGLKKYLRTLARNFPAIFPLAGVSFLFLVAGTYALRAIIVARGFPALWTYAPLEFLVLKIAIALFLYAALYNVFRRLPFPRNGSFYSAAALLFLLIDIGVISAFNVSFTYYFLWAFIFVFLSAVVRKRSLKALLFLPAVLPGLRGLITVFTEPALPFCRFLLLSPVWGNLLVAGVSLPFILVLLRLGLAFPGRGVLRRRVRELVLAGLLLAGGGVLGERLFTFSPFSATRPQPLAALQTIEVSETGDTTAATLDIASPAPLGALQVTDADGSQAIAPGRAAVSLPLPRTPSPVRIEEDSRQFLRLRNVTLHVAMPSSPRLLSLVLTAEEDFVLYDSSFPALRVSPREYRLLIGAFPPNPLDLQLTLPAGSSYTLRLSMDFDSPLLDAEVTTGRDARVTTRVRVVRIVGVKT